MARQQRVRLPRRAVLLRRQRRGLPRLAAAPLRRPRRAQRRLGDRLLEPALRRLGGGPAAPGVADLAQPHAAARLVALQLRRAARRSTAPSATPSARTATCRSRPTSWPRGSSRSTTSPGAARSTSSRTTTTCIGEDPAPEVELALSADLTARAGAAGAVAAHGDLHQRGQLAAAQPGQDAGRAAPARAVATSPAAPTGSCSSSGAPRAPARRSTTRGCVPHAGTDTKIWREVAALGAELAGLADVDRHAGRRDGRRCCGTTRAGGRSSSTATRRRTSRYLAAVRQCYEALWRKGVTRRRRPPGGRPRRRTTCCSHRASTC